MPVTIGWSMPTSVYGSLIVCETVLWEHTGLVSAIRIMDVLTVGASASPAWAARFYALSRLHTRIRGDTGTHTLTVVAIGPHDETVASAGPKPFSFGYA